MIRAATIADATRLAAIYNYYITDTIVTFEEEPLPASEMARRIEKISASLPWLVAELDGQVAGYAYGGPWNERRGYRFAAEVTVYLDQAQGGRGIGSALYGALIPMLEERGIHTIIGGIALPNAASVSLHEKFGMKQVAHYGEVGMKFGKWIDVGYWQRIL